MGRFYGSFAAAFLLVFLSNKGMAELSETEVHQLIVGHQIVLSKLKGKEKFEFINRFIEKDRLYKMFIDSRRLENPSEDERFELKKVYGDDRPEMLFDVKEPGYYAGMVKAFEKMGSTLDQKLDLELFVDLHDVAVAGATRITGESFKLGLDHDQACSYPLDKKFLEKNFSELAASRIILDQMELLGRMARADLECLKLNDKQLDFLIYGISCDDLSTYQHSERRVYSNHGTRESIRAKLEPFFHHYYESIQHCKTLEGVLSAIAELVRALEIGHVFADGNQRLNSFLVLNKLLIENRLPPAILRMPEMFDGI